LRLSEPSSGAETVDELPDLRARVREIDSRILRLVAERMDLVKSIGAVKRSRGVALRDFEVEKQVLDNAAETARELGIALDLARGVMQLLISESCLEQERLHYSAYGGGAERVLVVGGAGKMGQWFAQFFRNQGHDVRVFDPQPAPEDFPSCATLEAGLAEASVAVVASPLEATAEVIERIAAIGYAGIAFDIASLKGPLKSAIAGARARGIRLTSTHPMFGAGARTLSDKVICMCDCGDDEANRRVRGFFEETAATLVPLSLDEHDRIISYVLGLSHLVSIVFAHVLAGSGISYAQLCSVGSTTFLSQMKTTESVARENPDLYYAIQRSNPNTPGVYEAFAAGLERMTRSVLSEDRDNFVAAMERAKAWLDDPT
jgi:chorismate mutase/prephenate dehydrogenase